VNFLKFLGALTLAVAVCVTPQMAQANGRFPSSSYFVAGPGPESSVLALRTTFGLMSSYDGGRTWGWTCEEALDAVGMFESSMDIGFDGTIVVGSQRGLVSSRGNCAWGTPRGAPMNEMADIASDATAQYMVTVARTPTGTMDRVLVSNDGGASWTFGANLGRFFTQTIEIAPSDPRRVYVSGFITGAIAVFLRSDDGGMTFRETSRGAAFRSGRDMGNDAFISAVDPLNPDGVYVRSSLGLGTILFRSDDGGTSWRELTRTFDPMVGFALSDDGTTIWVGSSNRTEGIRRSDRGGAFRRVTANVTVRCLRQHGGVLYVCADEVADGYLLGTSIDGGERIDPLLSARGVTGVSSACSSGVTMVGSVCSPLWPAVAAPIRTIDAGALPTPVVRDASVVDVFTVLDRPASAMPDVAMDAVVDVTVDSATDAGMDVEVAPGDDGFSADLTDTTVEDLIDTSTEIAATVDTPPGDAFIESDATKLSDATNDQSVAVGDVTTMPGNDVVITDVGDTAAMMFDEDMTDATENDETMYRPNLPPVARKTLICGCRAGATEPSHHPWAVTLSLALIALRRTRRRAAQSH
jgi:MYXO-CTERM domain-containing protein